MYFVPGGRIGFKKPDEIGFWSNRWILLSQDHTLNVQIRETLRVDDEYDSPMWDKNNRSQEFSMSRAIHGFDTRRFHSLSYDPSLDYCDERIVLRDVDWMGELQVGTSDLGGHSPHPGGQIARWRKTMDDIQESIVVRPRPTVNEALSELCLDLDTTDLNPRFVGETLIFSLYPPEDSFEALGSGEAIIITGSLTLVPPGNVSAESEAFNTEYFASLREMPGARELTRGSRRGILLEESQTSPNRYMTSLHAFGRTRNLQMTAYYGREDRVPLLKALQRAFDSLTVHDWRAPG